MHLYETWWVREWDEAADEPTGATAAVAKVGGAETAFAALDALPALAVSTGRGFGAGVLVVIDSIATARRCRNVLLCSPFPTLGVVAA